MNPLTPTLVTACFLLCNGTVASAGDTHQKGFLAKLEGFQEVPAVSTVASGSFTAAYDDREGALTFELNYSGLEGRVQQSHIHLGQRGTTGGVSVFLCSNLGNGPAGVQACPDTAGSVQGVIRAQDVIGPTAQGIGAGEFAEVLNAIEEGVAYVNVHTTKVPSGEIRGQLRTKRDNKRDN